MNREHFLEGLREQYTEEIHEAYRECMHEGGKVVDFPGLAGRLARLQKNAQVEGLSCEEFRELVTSALPVVVEALDLETFAVKPLRVA